MKNSFVVMCAVLLLLVVGGPRSVAQAPELGDLGFNLNGTFIDVGGDATFLTDAAGLGIDLSSFNTTTGLGSIQLVYDPGTAGTFFFDSLLVDEVGTPAYNEFGATSGTPASGESWEIANWENANGVPGDIIYDMGGDAVNTSDALQNTNYLPEAGSNQLNTCNTLTGCNSYGSLALGDTFTLTSTEEEIVTITSSLTAPSSGFYLTQTNPDDGLNGGNATTLYYSLTAVEQDSGTNPPPPPPPPGTPEPSSWILMATGLGAGLTQLRRRFSFGAASKALSVVVVLALAMAATPLAKAQTVVTVPWDPTNLASPHTAYSGASITMGAVFTGAVSGHTYTYQWNYGDTSATGAVALSNANDLSTTHVYSVEADGVTAPTVGYTWTAVLTVTDTTSSAQYTGNYLVIWENNNLQSRVNVAIDKGLWYLHQDMYHPTATTGNWENCAGGYPTYACGSSYGSLNATNLQALEVNGHTPTEANAASDPYATDAAEALNWILLNRLTPLANAVHTVGMNPAVPNFICSDGTAPTTQNPTCKSPATQVFLNAGATSCTTPPCNFTFDGNNNGQMIYTPQVYNFGYELGMYVDALVATGTPNATAPSNAPVGIKNMTYQNIVQDLVDYTAYCQYGLDAYDVAGTVGTGYQRGQEPYQGGGWWYSCNSGDDNSVSQWGSIGLIAAQRGFGVTIPKIVTDMNNFWVTASQTVPSQDAATSAPVGTDPWASGSTYEVGSFGYNGNLYYSDAWGPFAVTPSGMVQMSLDGIGRTKNTTFGDASTDVDQRFNNAETWYADNFCNNPANGAYYAPRAYMYGLFSFTKSMLLHNPGGSLSPIQYLRTQTPNVFTGNSSIPANTIDWYAALSAAHGGTDPCDGVAQTLINDQTGPGYWYGNNYTGGQYPYETAWALIMLQRTVFVTCVQNLTGKGTASTSLNPARADLSWTGIPNVTGYNVLVSTVSGGPYTQVTYNGGTTTQTSFADETGLTNGKTYYFVLQPVNNTGAVCQSNQATITIPAKAR